MSQNALKIGNTKRPFDDVVIVAAGLGTRMGEYSNGIPKLLINIAMKTVLERIVESYGRDLRYRIICHSKHVHVIKAYADVHLSSVSVSITPVDEALGSAHALSVGANDLMDGRPVLVTWSDIYLTNKFSCSEIFMQTTGWANEGVSEPVIFTTPARGCRYVFNSDSRKIVKLNSQNGNVVGIYFIPNFTSFTYCTGDDFVDCIEQLSSSGCLEELRLGCTSSLPVDIGDIEKLQSQASLEKNNVSRAFNKIIDLGHDLLLKKPVDSRGARLAAYESNWYATLDKLDISAPIPKTWIRVNLQLLNEYDKFQDFASDDGIIMERVCGLTVFQAIQAVYKDLESHEHYEAVSTIIQRHVRAVSVLHEHECSLSKSDLMKAVRYEAVTKTADRFDHVWPIIEGINSTIDEVNGIKLPSDLSYRELALWLGEKICQHYENQEKEWANNVAIIHGDCNFSNALIDTGSNVTLIDPRGYFGHINCIGPIDYDYAKILYSISGYDGFNNAPLFCIKSFMGGAIEFNIEKPVSSEIAELLDQEIGSPVRTMWVALIWINLASYFVNNPIKAYAAFFHGLSLAAKIYKKENNK